MLHGLTCLAAQHDGRLAAGAAMVCAIACYAGTRLLLHSRTQVRRRELLWRGLAAISLGSGIWATHFIATLGYRAGLPIGFDPATTLMSALVPVAACYAGFSIAAPAAAHRAPWPQSACGGAIIGAGAVIMHFLGMAAWRLQGRLAFAPDQVAASVLSCTLLAAAAVCALNLDERHLRGCRGRASACIALLIAAIMSVHFTAMAAISVIADPRIAIPPMTLGRDHLALVVGTAAACVLGSLLLALGFDIKLATAQTRRLQGLADAAFEGIAVCSGAVPGAGDAGSPLVLAELNAALAAMLGWDQEKCRGARLADLFPPGLPDELPTLLAVAAIAPVAISIAAVDGPVPVELRVRRLTGRGRPTTVLVMRDLRERISADARIRHMAHHDQLTGLANRALLQERVTQEIAAARRSGAYLAMCCLDLDRFKTVNDSFGHAAGDRLLREAGRRLLEACRETDIVARLGGDEFVIVQTGLVQPEAAKCLAERLIDALAAPFDLGGGQQAAISLSLGIAMYPADGQEPDGLMAAADLALYRVKEGGRNGFAFYRPEMDQAERARRSLEQDIRLALDRGELSLAIQPQSDLRSGRITGFEALLRWTHPVRGQVPPSLFIPAAEASGAIVPIGAWVLLEACRLAASWQVPHRIAVNVSGVQLRHTGFAALVADTLARSGLAPGLLELEMTESVLIGEADGALATLRQIKAIGVQIAMDDFGTGYSSLGMLRLHAFDRIKLDRSFVIDIATSREARAILHAMVTLADGLRIPILAEGVEDATQLAALRDAGVAEVQGYLIGRPGPESGYRHLTEAAVPARAAARESLPPLHQAVSRPS